MTRFRMCGSSPHLMGTNFRCPRNFALCGVIVLALFILADQKNAEAFVQKAIEQLLRSKECVRCDLRGAQLARKDLRSSKLIGAYLIGANLTGANLAGADLRGAWLTKANLRQANFEGAILRGAHLLEADFSGANLQHADLRSAKLGRAILTGATLSGTSFAGAKLQAARLDKTRHLKQRQIDRACGNTETVLPPGISVLSCADTAR